MSITVAVRVRPFNQREKALNSKLCVKMEGNQTIIKPKGSKSRTFAFDYSFWSHDQFEEQEDGFLVPKNEKYADQDSVYNLVGKQVLKNAIDGYHCCLFAYGQTGSGKSYSMVGYGENKGIVPKISFEIFDMVQNQTTKKKWYEVNVSMLEIYNEKVQDLLIHVDKRPFEGLKIRENKTLGVYVESLSKHPVSSYDQIEQKMNKGSQNRTIASTLMNACSSRAHTIITIEFAQFEIINGKKVSRFSQINLVDLAGSEKFNKTGASGDRLKEGCSINKSLTVLGKVISNLADKSMGKGKNTVTPYRESSLTRILQNALGGNSKTLMICAISPSDNNYDETLSTLRYADQAKKIKCHAVINESEADKKIRQLQKENDDLKELIKKLQKGDLSGLTNLPQEQEQQNNTENQVSEQEKKEQEEMLKKIQDLEETLKANNLVMEEYQKSFEERLQEEKEKEDSIQKQDLQIPHLTNLNEDQMLQFKIYHNFVDRQQIVIGRGSKDFKPDIIIRGIGMQEKHAVLIKEGEQFFIEPGCEEAMEFMCLNGNKIEKKLLLNHLDRIAIGFNTIFLFRNPLCPTPPYGFESERDIDWEKAQAEISNKLLKININPEDNIKNQQKYIEIENHVKKIKDEYQQQIDDMQTKHSEKMKQIQDEMINNSMQVDLLEMEKDNFEHYKQMFNEDFQKQIKTEMNKKDEFEKQYIKNFKENDKKKLEDKMYKINPNVIEANLIAQELGRNIQFKLLINFSYVDFEDIKFNEKNKVNAKVEVDNKELGYTYQWDIEKFTLRYIMFRELLDQYYLTGQLPEISQEDDPFYDPREPVILGEGFVKLMSLAYLVDNPNELILVGDNGQVAKLNLNLIPVDENGEELDEDHEIFEDFIDDPQDLFGKSINFLVNIDEINLNVKDFENLFIEYDLQLQNEQEELVENQIKTNTILGSITIDNFKYSKQFCYNNFSQKVLSYLLNSNLCFELKGTPKLQEVIQTPPKLPVQEEVQKQQPIPVKKSQKQDVNQKQISEYNQKMIEDKKKRMEKTDKEKTKKKKKNNCIIF